MSNFKRYYYNDNIIFITVVTYNRCNILVDNIELLRNSLKSVKYEFKIIAGIVLPNHLHLLTQIKDKNEVSKIVASFKSYFSRQLPFNDKQTKAQICRKEKGIWQRKYYDHIIRDENDLKRHLDYIHYNSMKHYNIAPKDWKYSSFCKFVKEGFYDKDWCNIDDKNDIISLALE